VNFFLSVENFDLLTRKGIFPYEYVNCVEKLEEAESPSRFFLYESFYSSLIDGTVSESDYAHVNVWQRFFIWIFDEYNDLYLKTMYYCWPIFENFRDSCITRTRSCVLLYTTGFYGTRCWNILASISNFLSMLIWFYSSNVVYVAVWINVQTDQQQIHAIV